MPQQFLLIILFIVLSSVNRGVADELAFETDIRPIFRAHCFDCHGATSELEGNLDLRLVRFLEKGGDSGAAIIRGDAEASYLLQRVKDGEMPPGNQRVPSEQIATLEKWIRQGAKTARPEPASIGPGLGLTREERAYWAFQPIRRPAVPAVQAAGRVRTPIDAFLLARMEPKGLTFAADADKVTVIRRAYLDLLGLPPTPEQVSEFLADESDAAWETLIDELLDSPHYGERWGRHWLDVAGYADSEGYNNRDEVRAWAYKYRDWVIRAMNQDMPFDQFITWQLAGDELTERPYKNMTPRQIDQLTATGFLRMAADGTGSDDNETSRNQVMTDTLKIVSSSLLGMSVGCAQCHDHRYDPISQLDYYRLRGVFEPAIDYKHWIRPAGRRVSLFTDEDIAQAEAIEREAQAKAAEKAAKQEEFMEAALQAELARYEAPLRDSLADAYRTPGDKRTPEQQGLLKEHPNIASLHPGVLYQYNQGNADILKECDKQIAAIRARKPREEFLRGLTEPNQAQLPVTHLFYRGDYRQPQQEVEPGGLTVAAPAESPFVIADNDPALPSSGRRLAYARWLTSGRHPLVARVLVNRFWLHHFGKGFVSTPDEFGKLGSPPTHPDLLDWLADEFMAQGWSLKHLHRLIMKSTVYRQASLRSAEAELVDGGNGLYAHFPVQRLEAEVIRDAVLAVSGRLDSRQYGPPVEIVADDAGQIVVQGDHQRRSIYLQVRRTQPVAILKSFDAPVMEVNCAARQSSTVATQSLMLMNSNFVLEFSKAFAERINHEAKEKVDVSVPAALLLDASKCDSADSSLPSPSVEQLVYGWQLAYGRAPTAEEVHLAAQFLHQQLAILTAQGHEAPAVQALTNYCQALLSSNEFLYVE